MDTAAVSKVAAGAGGPAALAAATGAANAAGEAVGDAIPEMKGVIDELKNCIKKYNKEDIIKSIKDLPGNLTKAKQELDNILNGKETISHSEVKKFIKKMIDVFNKDINKGKNLVSCIIGKGKLRKQFTDLSYSQGRMARTQMFFSKSSSKMAVGFGLFKGEPNPIPVADAKKIIEKEIDPFLKIAPDMATSTGELVNTAFDAAENGNIAELGGAVKECMDSISQLSGGSNSMISVDGGSGSDPLSDSGMGTDLTGNEPGSNPISDFSESARKMHEQGTLKDYLNSIIESIGLYFGVFFLLITMPAMPVIFYLSILYNVILLTWEKFKGLDTYQ